MHNCTYLGPSMDSIVIHRYYPVNDVIALELTTHGGWGWLRSLANCRNYVGAGRGQAGWCAGGTCLSASLVWYLNNSIEQFVS